jgi:cytochrome P450
MHHLNMPTMAASYEKWQYLESSRLVHDLIEDPSHYERWFEYYSSGLLLRLGYGKLVETGEENYVRRIIQVVRTVERMASPVAYLVDSFPILMWLPKFLAPFKREGERLHKEEPSLFRELPDDVKSDVAKGDANPSSAKTWLEKRDEYGLVDDEAAYVFGTLFEAGSDTTSATMLSWKPCTVLYPKWLEKQQEDIDRVIGTDRLPDFHDMLNLPTMRAVVKEVLRF